MPAGAVFVFGSLLGAAALAAASRKKTAAAASEPEAPPGPRPGSETHGGPTMDATLDDGTRGAVLRALATETDPAKLEAFGDALLTIAPVAASLLLAKARSLGGSPTPHAPEKAPGGLDANLDGGTSAAVLHALASETDAARLLAFAATLQLQYPIAAALLLAKAQELARAQEHGAPPPVLVTPPPETPHEGPHAAPPPAATPRTRPPAPGPRTAPAPAPHAAPPPAATPRTRPPAPGPARPSPGPAPAPHEAAPVLSSVCTFPVVDGASCIDAPRALAAAPTGFTTPKTWPPDMTKQAQNIYRSSATPAGVYYVYYAGDGGLYRFTKSASNTVLASSHDVHVASLAQAPAVAAPHHPDAPPAARPPAAAPPAYAPPASSASCPFPLEPGVSCLDATTAMRTAAGPFTTPKTWPPVMTKQAVAANRSSATPAGVYYVACSADGRVYKVTKSAAGNTTLQSAAGVTTSPAPIALQARA
jgi:hypothetical protein